MIFDWLKSLLVSAACAGCLVGSTACNDSPTVPSGPSALNRTDVRTGTGAEAVAGSLVTVHYTGWFYNPDQANQRGAQFDSSAGRDPFTFILGAGQVIEGWDQGLVGMRVGGLRRLIIPPSLAYGAVRNNVIPPHATLMFDVELLEVQ